jgi:hypothetical protein
MDPLKVSTQFAVRHGSRESSSLCSSPWPMRAWAGFVEGCLTQVGSHRPEDTAALVGTNEFEAEADLARGRLGSGLPKLRSYGVNRRFVNGGGQDHGAASSTGLGRRKTGEQRFTWRYR